MGRYSNPSIASTLERIVAGQGRDRVSTRPVQSLRQKQYKLTRRQVDEVVERYEAGESANVLAIEFGVHRGNVVRQLKARGVVVRYRIMSDEDLALAETLYEQGQSLAKVGDEFGVAAWTVLAAFKRAGIPTRSRGTNQWSQRSYR